jgi:hypothetical protein
VLVLHAKKLGRTSIKKCGGREKPVTLRRKLLNKEEDYFKTWIKK